MLPWAALAALLIPQLLLKIGSGALGCGNEGAELPKRLARAREAKRKPSSGCELLLAVHLAKHRGEAGVNPPAWELINSRCAQFLTNYSPASTWFSRFPCKLLGAGRRHTVPRQVLALQTGLCWVPGLIRVLPPAQMGSSPKEFNEMG